jgi:hypothetical protein
MDVEIYLSDRKESCYAPEDYCCKCERSFCPICDVYCSHLRDVAYGWGDLDD